jgi:cystathionine beta-lyase/cystathionine gamma-synthase
MKTIRIIVLSVATGGCNAMATEEVITTQEVITTEEVITMKIDPGLV